MLFTPLTPRFPRSSARRRPWAPRVARVVVALLVGVATALGIGVLAGSSAQAITAPPAWPTSKGNAPISKPVVVRSLLDGGMRTYCCVGDGSQNERQPEVFDLAPGATLQNVIIGAPAGKGVLCRGSCTLRNVWWLDVGENAASFRGGAGSVYRVIGGGARGAADKLFQQSGEGTTIITDFYAENVGKFWRACGNCPGQKVTSRRLQMAGVYIKAPVKIIVGVNSNFGDQATINSLTIAGDRTRKIPVCEKYIGNNTGVEPSSNGVGPDATNCLYNLANITYR